MLKSLLRQGQTVFQIGLFIRQVGQGITQALVAFGQFLHGKAARVALPEGQPSLDGLQLAGQRAHAVFQFRPLFAQRAAGRQRQGARTPAGQHLPRHAHVQIPRAAGQDELQHAAAILCKDGGRMRHLQQCAGRRQQHAGGRRGGRGAFHGKGGCGPEEQRGQAARNAAQRGAGRDRCRAFVRGTGGS